VCGGILAQIGEFSFLLISLGDEMRIVSREHQQLLVTLTTLSLAFSPLWISLLDRWGEPFLNWIKRLKKQTSPGLLSVVEDTPAPGHPKNKEM
jgi:predicted Kef-type K+ transport protein